MALTGRALHFVLKIANREKNIEFFRDVLGMKVLRHEEFKEGCDAQCNGPYDNRWSKTMIGYGDEDSHFVVELTYNYNVHNYELGNDFRGITIHSKEAVDKAKSSSFKSEEQDKYTIITSPDGYKFYLANEDSATKDPVQKVTLASSNLNKSVEYWNKVLGLKLVEKTDKTASFAFEENQAKLELQEIGTSIDHKTAYGRIAFSVPEDELKIVDSKIKEIDGKILTPLTSLDTPGKATVTVIILADPDGHEICFVGDKGFRDLSAFDPEADKELRRFIKKDAERSK